MNVTLLLQITWNSFPLLPDSLAAMTCASACSELVEGLAQGNTNPGISSQLRVPKLWGQGEASGRGMAAPLLLPCLHSSSVATASPAQHHPSCAQQESCKTAF